MNKNIWKVEKLIIFSGLLLLISSSTLLCNSINSSFRTRYYSTDKGLSQNYINCIFQDNTGFLWFGTNDGLNKFNGSNFEVYRPASDGNTGLSGNLIFDLDQDKNQQLWVGTTQNGISKVDLNTRQIFSYNHFNKIMFPPGRTITCLKVDQSGNIIIGSNQGISLIKTSADTLISNKFYSDTLNNTQSSTLDWKRVYAIHIDGNGEYWIGKKNGLFKATILWDKEIILSPVKEFTGIAIYAISELGKDLIISCNFGTYILSPNIEDGKQFVVHQIFKRKGNKILVDKENRIWVGSSNELVLLSKTTQKGSPYSYEEKQIARTTVTSLFEDKTGLVWCGTANGIYVFNPQEKPFKTFLIGNQNEQENTPQVNSIFQDSKKNLWIGTEGEGICVLENYSSSKYANKNNFITPSSEMPRFPRGISEYSPGKMLVSTLHPEMLLKLSFKNKTIISERLTPEFANSAAMSFFKDKNDNIWVATYGIGLVRFNMQNDEIVNLRSYQHRPSNKKSLSSDIIRNVLQDRQGNIWIGSADGLNLLRKEELDKESPEFIVFENNPNDSLSISYNYILPILESSEGDIWIGTMGGGLNKLISTNGKYSFERYTTADGLPNNTVLSLQEDKLGNIWISTNNGLARLNPKTREIKTYDESDGLQGTGFFELASEKLSSGELVFGGSKGFTVFDPLKIKDDSSTSSLIFTSLSLLNKEVDVNQKINGRILLDKDISQKKKLELKYNENSFTVSFSYLHFVAPEKNQYKYMLNGFDGQWIMTKPGINFAKYTNLNPGTYTLKVIASNSDGCWMTKPTTIEIVIKPPYWLTKVAIIIYIILLFALIYFFQSYSIIKIRKKNELLLAQFEKEKIAELSQMKLRFFTNISHEFRTPLTLINGPINRLIQQDDNLLPEERKSNYSLINKNVQILIRLINQLMDFRKFEQGKLRLSACKASLNSFLNETYLSFSELAIRRNIDFILDLPDHPVLIWFDADKMEKIINNILSNAFKFTKEHGTITLGVHEKTEDSVEIFIEDTGIGIPESMQPHVFERFFEGRKIKDIEVGSTGIGLSFTKDLVELHHGIISFKSTEGIGSEFYVELPKGNQHLEKDEIISEEEVVNFLKNKFIQEESSLEIEAEKESQVLEDQFNLNNRELILVVDDNPDVRDFIKSSFKEQFNFIEAENGKDALDLCLQRYPDLILSDVMMPIMDGFEFCDKVKSDIHTSHIPVILLTAKTAEIDQVTGFRQGADAYVTKPFNPDVLKERILTLIETRRKLKERFQNSLDITPEDENLSKKDKLFIVKILEIVENNISEPDFSVTRLTEEYGLNRVTLNKKLKAITGHTANTFIRKVKLKRAAKLLQSGEYNVSEVTNLVGFQDKEYFRNCFKEEFKQTPSEYLKG